MANIEQNIEKLVEKNINELGYELYDVEYVKEGKDYFLRIYIDSSKGISLEDCEKVSNSITEIIDSADYIKEQYFLEVSSTGVERVLRKDRHLKENIGSKVQIKLFKPFESKKTYDGILDDFNDNYIELKNENKNVQIERKNISQIKTIYDWKI
ncbi:MAG: ribosome maturation factor RimP [Clostridiales bacterium]|nr:ribosome maturation factor RimP [Clostridiales bacterium]